MMLTRKIPTIRLYRNDCSSHNTIYRKTGRSMKKIGRSFYRLLVSTISDGNLSARDQQIPDDAVAKEVR